MLNLCCGLCGGSAVLALDVGDLQDGQQQLKCILDVVGAVGALRIGNNPSSSSHVTVIISRCCIVLNNIYVYIHICI